MEETTAMTTTTFLGTVGEIFGEAISWMGDVATAIAGNPILLVFCALPLVGLGIGIFKRLLNVN